MPSINFGKAFDRAPDSLQLLVKILALVSLVRLRSNNRYCCFEHKDNMSRVYIVKGPDCCQAETASPTLGKKKRKQMLEGLAGLGIQNAQRKCFLLNKLFT